MPLSPRQARRRLKLAELVRSVDGGAAQVARETGTQATHLSAMLAGRRGLGDKLAARIERRYEKPVGWFDLNDAFWPFSGELWAAVQSLSPLEMARLERVMRGMLNLPFSHPEHIESDKSPAVSDDVGQILPSAGPHFRRALAKADDVRKQNEASAKAGEPERPPIKGRRRDP